MPLTLSSTNEEKVVGCTVNPTTSTGKPSAIQAGSLTITIVDGNPNATANVTSDTTFDVISGDGEAGVGSTTFRVDADADLGDGVVTLSDTVVYNVTGAQAVNLGLGSGTVSPK